MQASITSNVWSDGVNAAAAGVTSPVNTLNCWFAPVASYHATGNAIDDDCPFGGSPSDTLTTGAFDPLSARRRGDRYLIHTRTDVLDRDALTGRATDPALVTFAHTLTADAP